MAPNTEPLALSPAAAARFLGLSKRTIYNLLAAGTISARRAGKRTLIEVASLRKYLDSLPAFESGDRLFP